MTNPLVLTAVISDQTVDVSVPAAPTLNFTPDPGQPLAIVTIEGPLGPVGPVGPTGPTGEQGPAGDGVAIARETPTGAINGTNTVFTLANNFQTGTTLVYLNGLVEFFATELPPNQIEFSTPPAPGDAIRVGYTVNG